MWKKGKDIVALDKTIWNKEDKRVKLEEAENGNTLMILLADPHDISIPMKC